MKKLISILLALSIAFVFAACSNGSGDSGITTAKADRTAQTGGKASANAVPTVLNSTEYVLYQNIFYQDQGKQYDGKEVTKNGTFTTIEDKYSNKTRYYVWGYNDATKCCDWQWEFVPDDPSTLPSIGSLVSVTGTFVYDDNALDKYWIINPTVTVDEEYKGKKTDFDLTTMSATLERVQLFNIQNYPDDFQGKDIYLYGRVLNPNSIQHPYYNESWSQDFTTDGSVPAIGTCVIVHGTYQNGVIESATVTETFDY